MNNLQYFNMVLSFAISKGLIEEEYKSLILEKYAPKEENTPLFKFKNAIFCAYCDDLIDSIDSEKIMLLLDLKMYQDKKLQL